jgi:hypothetical protein
MELRGMGAVGPDRPESSQTDLPYSTNSTKSTKFHILRILEDF